MIKSRKPIRLVSVKRQSLNRDYNQVKRQWKADLQARGIWLCQGCYGIPEDSPHHLRGRVGALLCHRELFVALCRTCHQWTHDNPEAARKMNLLCEKGLWGRQPK